MWKRKCHGLRAKGYVEYNEGYRKHHPSLLFSLSWVISLLYFFIRFLMMSRAVWAGSCQGRAELLGGMHG